MLLAASPILALYAHASPSTLYSELDKAMQSWQSEQSVNSPQNVSEFEAFKQQHLKDFNAYIETQMAEFDKFRDELLKSWGEAQVTSQSQFVSYSSDNQARLNVDFENNTLTLSVKHKQGKVPSKEEVESIFQNFMRSEQALFEEFYSDDSNSKDNRKLQQSETTRIDKKLQAKALKLAMQEIKQQTRLQQQALDKKYDAQLVDTNEVNSSSAKLEEDKATLKRLEQKRLQDLKKNVSDIVKNAPKETLVTQFQVTLPKTDLLSQRAEKYLAPIKKQSERFSLPAATILAVMHTESHFNPMAKSHIPAFGLMQVVPTSAGIDVNRFLYDIDAPMSAPYLYVSDNNIEAGSAYLHLLDDRYLKHINDPLSRKYCMIAAYNTGAGNVARAFNSDGSRSIKRASKIINSMSPERVLEVLSANLPYEETRKYIHKVLEKEQLYAVDNTNPQ